MTRDEALGGSVDDTVIASFANRLATASPSLARDAEAHSELVDRARRILQMVRRGIEGDGDVPLPPGDVGASRARADVHPSESLRAAGALFETALAPLCTEYEHRATHIEVARHLHAAINRLLVEAAVSYVDVLLDRLSGAHQEERRRIARELHDRTSHGLGAALRGLELASFRMQQGMLPDADQLTQTQGILLDTLNDVREMSSRLRDAVGERSITEALRDFVAVMAPGEICFIDSEDDDGRLVDLPSFIKEETYLILREAVRNAVVHGTGRTKVQVSMTIREGRLHASVMDDGVGFDADQVVGGRTVGLPSMSERAEGLGGRVALHTRPGAGVVLELVVPLPGTGR